LESGFAATSLDAVAKQARVTKGAIYHHFASKRDLFLAVMERQEEINARTVDEAATAASDPWSAIVAAFDAFLDTIADPVYQRLCFVEGPAALGFEDWWAWGERTEIDLIRRQLDRVAEADALLIEDHDMLAHVLFGAVTAGVLAIARAEDPGQEQERFRTVMLQLMHGMVRMEAFKPPWSDGGT
jgi:AcrR family transcriptional regulator